MGNGLVDFDYSKRFSIGGSCSQLIRRIPNLSYRSSKPLINFAPISGVLLRGYSIVTPLNGYQLGLGSLFSVHLP